MKRTVYNTMIGLMLACGLAMTSTGAMAQGRRPASNSNAAAAGNRSVATATPRNNNAATVTNNVAPASRSTATTARQSVTSSPQVNRNSSASSNASNRTATSTSTTRPSVNKGSTSTSTARPSTSGNRSSSVRPSAGNRSASGNSVSTTINTSTNNVRPATNTNNGGSNLRPGSNNSGSNNTVRHGSTGNNGSNRGHVAVPSRRPSDNRPKVAGTVMTGASPKVDYNAYRYTSSWRPRYDGDRFFNNYRYNSWSWASPIRPSVRPWRPTTVWVYRPIVTVNISRYSSYPTIGGVLGLAWGTSFGNVLNYLYYSGYYIDGYMDNVVYLTNVSLLNYDWDDVMIQFDGNNRMDYVEFAYWDSSYDTSRYYSLYNYLCSMYGSPVSYNNAMYSWYGGDGIGFVNLGLQYTPDYNYTILAFGV